MTIRKRIAENPPELPHSLPQLLDEKQTAAYLGLSVSYLRKSRSDGGIKGRTPAPPFLKIGGKVRYRLTDLDAWITSLKPRMAV